MTMIESREQVPIPPPTELTLFRNINNQRSDLLVFSAQGQALSRDLTVNNRRYINERDDVDHRLDAKQRVILEKMTLESQYSSYRTASAGYLRLNGELSAMGVPEDEILKTFLKCFYVACDYYDRYSSQSNGSNEIAFRKAEAAKKAGLSEHMKVFGSIAGDPPEWFGKSRERWHEFIGDYSTFAELNPNLGTSISNQDFGFVARQWIPNWLENAEEKLPNEEEIRDELASDTAEIKSLKEHTEFLINQGDMLEQYLLTKYVRAVKNLESRRRTLFENSSSLPNFLVYLHVTENMNENQEDLNTFDRLTKDEIQSQMVSSERSREKSINIFSNERPVDLDVVALWLERKFKEAGIPASTVLDVETVRRLGLVTDDANSDLRSLRETDKKFFNTFNYELKPLIQLLPKDGQQYYKELVQISAGETLETVIWEMAYLISNRLSSTDAPADPKATSEIRKFSVNWLRNNWQWAYGELEKVLKSDQGVEVPEPESLQEAEDIQVNNEESIDQLTQEIETGNLASWDVAYTTNMRAQEGARLIEVGGETLEDKEAALTELLLHEGAQVSIKDSSIVNALDWISTIPPEVLYMMPSLEVNGEVFKKIKRGAVRILFQRDEEAKKITFFLHQKKAMEYRL